MLSLHGFQLNRGMDLFAKYFTFSFSFFFFFVKWVIGIYPPDAQYVVRKRRQRLGYCASC